MADDLSFIDQANTSLYLAMLAQGVSQGLQRWVAKLPEQLDYALNKEHNSNIPQWHSAVSRLPQLTHPVTAVLDADAVGVQVTLTDSEYRQSHSLLRQLMPWRKGPYQFGDKTAAHIAIDTEWRSDFKWQRVQPHISDLTHRKVLDVGGGNGYHAWRMAGAGASFVLVVDPSPLFYYQFMAVKQMVSQDRAYTQHRTQPSVHFLPIGIEQVPAKLAYFDTVFSMGVFYHRPAPFEHIQQLKDCLRSGGELVLETLVVEGDETTVLVPQTRYAGMHNVYFFPSSAALCVWLEKAGFVDVRVVDEGNTSLDEQRQTDWMTYHSLAQFLDENDQRKTIEGYPAPRRAVVVATRA